MTVMVRILILAMLLLAAGCQSSTTDSVKTDQQKQTQQTVVHDPVPVKPAAEPDIPVQDKAESSEPAASDSLSGMSWYLKTNLEHSTPAVDNEVLTLLQNQKAHYVYPRNGQQIYLTFDEGYELGYTHQILDILASQDVKATFFITGHYLKSQPDLVKRMVAEGHQVANHTYHHPDLSKVSQDKFQQEISQLDQEFQTLTGTVLAKFLRPPMGNYSASSLSWADDMGYTTIFWSLAFHDWDPQDQPGRDYSLNYVREHIHPGAVILLHAVSESNTQALPDIIAALRQDGYEFSLLPQ